MWKISAILSCASRERSVYVIGVFQTPLLGFFVVRFMSAEISVAFSLLLALFSKQHKHKM